MQIDLFGKIIENTNRHAPSNSPKDDQQMKLEKAAKQFEGMVIQEMMKSMRKTVPKSEVIKSQSQDFYWSMLDRAVIDAMPESFGLKEAILQQFGGEEK